MNQKTKQIIIAVILIIVGFFTVQYFLGSTDEAPLTQDDRVQDVEGGREIIVLLNRLNQVTLNSSIFNNKVFLGLVNFEKPIPDQPIGRPNPFAPVGNDALIPTTSGTTTGTTTRLR
jgi:hypothetical protein